jgi:hypothetical protein
MMMTLKIFIKHVGKVGGKLCSSLALSQKKEREREREREREKIIPYHRR